MAATALSSLPARHLVTTGCLILLLALSGCHPAPPPAPPTPSMQSQLDALGKPVEVPPDMDARYTVKGLTDAIQLAGQNAGVTVKNVTIDDSEYPFLVALTTDGPGVSKLEAQLKTMDGYEWTGGAGDETFSVFNIVPVSTWPKESRGQIVSRRVLRAELFYQKIHARDHGSP